MKPIYAFQCLLLNFFNAWRNREGCKGKEITAEAAEIAEKQRYFRLNFIEESLPSAFSAYSAVEFPDFQNCWRSRQRDQPLLAQYLDSRQT
jgi:hypothetical protein